MSVAGCFALKSSRADGCLGTWPAVSATARHRTVPQGKSRHATRARVDARGGVAGMARNDSEAERADAAIRERITDCPCTSRAEDYEVR